MINRRQKADTTDLRIRLVGALMLALFAVAVVRAVNLQIYRADALKARAEDQYSRKIKMLPSRGKIFDRNMEELAASDSSSSAYVTGQKILNDPEEFARIAKALALDRNEAAALVRKRGDAFTTIKRRLTPAEEEAAKAIAKNSKFFGVAPQPARFYPNKALGGQILGYVGQDGEGLGGLEYKYDELLRGNPVWLMAEKDAKADQLISEAPDLAEGRGKSLVLTIDQNIQHIVEEELEAAVEERGAKAGYSMVLDPATGEILALAQVPRINPNDYLASKAEDRKIKTISDVFEPGSTMKPVFIAMGLEAGAIKPFDTVYCEGGKWKTWGGKVIHDHSPHGLMGLPEIIKVSSNIGVAKLSQRFPNKSFNEMQKKFGFGRETGIDLRGESKGLLPDPSTWAKITPMTMAYGQGIAVTMVQMSNAFAALANHGVMMRPHLVKAVLDQHGNEIERTEPKELSRPVSPQVADMVLQWMKAVVMEKGGTANAADGSGYTAAGKTGTAQKPGKGGYSDNKVVGSFFGIAPADSPRVVVAVAIDEPTKGSRFGGVVAAPVFKNVTRRVLNYMAVVPDRPVQVAEKEKKDEAKAKKKEEEAKKLAAREKEKEAAETDEEAMLAEAAAQAFMMPDLTGLTMREAVKRLEQTGFKMSLDLRGSGYVARQEPPPGSTLQDGLVCIVTFDSTLNIAANQ